MHFVGPSAILSARAAPIRERAVIIADARATVSLYRAVDNTLRHILARHFDHRISRRNLYYPPDPSWMRLSVSSLTARLDPRFGEVVTNLSLRRQRPAEGRPLADAPAHRFERTFGETDQAHAMVNPSGPETTLRDLEAAAGPEQHIRGGHPHVLKNHFGMAVRRVVVPKTLSIR